MKKLLSVLIAAVLLMTSLCAGAASLDFLTNPSVNLTQNSQFSIKFDNPKDICSLLKELNMPEQVSYFTDMEKLLSGLLSFEGTYNAKIDCAKDYSKGKVEVTSTILNNTDVNRNLNISSKSNFGVWVDYDMTSQTPRFKTIVSYPFMDRYLVSDSADTEKLVPGLTQYYSNVLNKDFVDSTNTFAAGLLAKYANITVSGGKCTIKIDNAGLLSMIREGMGQLSAICAPLLGDKQSKADFENALGALSSFKDFTILGKDGITLTYNFSGTKITSYTVDIDISLDLKELYKNITGNDWGFVSQGKVDFTVTSKGTCSNYDKTSVTLPNLTKENSVSAESLLSSAGTSDTDFPLFGENKFGAKSVFGISPQLPVIDASAYLPLRSVLEDSLGDKCSISYDNGAVTISVDGSSPIYINENSDKAYKDNEEYLIGKVTLIDGKLYVSQRFFEKYFGLTLVSATYDLFEHEYSFYLENN